MDAQPPVAAMDKNEVLACRIVSAGAVLCFTISELLPSE